MVQCIRCTVISLLCHLSFYSHLFGALFCFDYDQSVHSRSSCISDSRLTFSFSLWFSYSTWISRCCCCCCCCSERNLLRIYCNIWIVVWTVLLMLLLLLLWYVSRGWCTQVHRTDRKQSVLHNRNIHFISYMPRHLIVYFEHSFFRARDCVSVFLLLHRRFVLFIRFILIRKMI